ncbi:MAG: hypothetical protein AB1529_03435 [Candidatus Micrarchaeota archaeon]
MGKLRIMLILVLFSSAVFSLLFPLEDAKVNSGCLDYVEPGENNIVGYPDENLGGRESFEYDFDFFLPEVDANSEDLRIDIKRHGGFDNSCNDPFNLFASVNGGRAAIGKNLLALELYPDQSLSTGINGIYLSNDSADLSQWCAHADCPHGAEPRPGLCVFRVCGYYPNLSIISDVPLPEINYNESLNLSL